MSARGDFSRQSFLGEGAEEILANSRVAIVGLGGGGSHIAQQLAHAGVGHFRLFDPQCVDASNLNRLVTATQGDVDRYEHKVAILERAIKAVRPWAEVESSEVEWTRAVELLKGCHAVFGCVDKYLERQNLERACRRFHIPYFDIGMNIEPLGSGGFAVSGQMIMSRPGRPCMHCLGFLTSARLARELEDYGAAGPAPQVVWANGVLASLAVGAFVHMACPWSSHRPDYLWLEYEGNGQTVTASDQPRFNVRGSCVHYPESTDLGDPGFSLCPE